MRRTSWFLSLLLIPSCMAPMPAAEVCLTLDQKCNLHRWCANLDYRLTCLFHRQSYDSGAYAIMPVLQQISLEQGQILGTLQATPRYDPNASMSAVLANQQAILQLLLHSQTVPQTIPVAPPVSTPAAPPAASQPIVYVAPPQANQQATPLVISPSYPQSQQSLPISGPVQQTLPISGPVQQALPISGTPQQSLPIAGTPQQSLPGAGPVQQALPMSPGTGLGPPAQSLPIAPPSISGQGPQQGLPLASPLASGGALPQGLPLASPESGGGVQQGLPPALSGMPASPMGFQRYTLWQPNTWRAIR